MNLTVTIEQLAVNVSTEHMCIDSRQREHRPLPPPLAAWVYGGGSKL